MALNGATPQQQFTVHNTGAEPKNVKISLHLPSHPPFSHSGTISFY